MLGFRSTSGKRFYCVTLALLGMLVVVSGCSSSNSGQAATTPTPTSTPAGQAPEDAAEPAEEEDAIAVGIRSATLESLSSLYHTSATLRADKQATVTARTRGVVRQLLVEEGDRVRAGQQLAILENEEQQIEFDRARATRDTKVREYERALRLHEQGLSSDEEFETRRREAAEARHTASLAELMLERTVILAPFAGTILVRHLDAGGTVSDGASVYDLADVSPLYADVNVPERQITRLAPGQTVRLTADSSETQTTAIIERIAPQVDAATGTIKVTLAVKSGRGMRPGSFVRVAIVTDTHADALVVPRSALVAEGRRWHLFRVAAEDKVQRLEVARGFEEGDRVEILETVQADTPLAAGDRVVVVGASALTDGAKIRTVEPDGDSAQAGDASGDEDSRVTS